MQFCWLLLNFKTSAETTVRVNVTMIFTASKVVGRAHYEEYCNKNIA
jgi:hypothetical protein